MAYQELNESMTGITDFLVFPLTSDYYFYAKIYLGLFAIFSFILYFEERGRTGRANYISCMAISSIVTVVLGFAGSLIGIITNDILTIMLALMSVLVVLWFAFVDN